MTLTRQALIDKYDLTEKRFQGLKKLMDDLCSQPESEANLNLIKKSLQGEFSILNSYFVDSAEKLSLELKKASYDNLSRRALLRSYDHDMCPALKEPFEYQEEKAKSVEVSKISISSMSILRRVDKEDKRKPSFKNILIFKK